jgi:hypothetical protein
MPEEQEMNGRYLRHIIAKSRKRLRELEEMKRKNPNVPNVAIEAEKAHLKKCEAQLVALNN